jgi:hypothetical protein
MITKHAVDGDSVPHFALINGLLRYKGRVWIGSHQDLHLKITAPMHDSALGGGGGHSGAPVAYRRLKQHFAWKGMKIAVHDFVQSCLVCQQAKSDRAKYPGLLQPVSIPNNA